MSDGQPLEPGRRAPAKGVHIMLGRPNWVFLTVCTEKLWRVMRRYRLANTPPVKRKLLRKDQSWSEDFTAKLFCNVEFCLERQPILIEPQQEFERLDAAGQSLLPRARERDSA